LFKFAVMSRQPLIFLSAFGLAVCPALLILIFTMDVDVIGIIVLFAAVFTLGLLLFNYIYRKSEGNQLASVYQHLTSLKNIKEKQFSSSENDILRAEVYKILDEWSGESRQEIDQLKQVETYRKEFLGNVSHELKTPIFSIQGYVHTLIDGGIDDPDVNMLYLRKASKGIDRLISMVEDLESISKLEAGELPVEYRTFDIYDLSREVIESVEVLTKDKRTHLYISDNAARPAYAYADKDLIRQVLINLVVNSIKYGKKDGESGINIFETGEKYTIEVTDDGLGIERYHLPRLFERFYRVDKSRSREEGGTGLGLAIVKHIIEAHHQNIHVESEPGRGTTFSFTLKKSK
jgi:two-component system phosphate regulon sensor histidine kinase PhoR